MYWLPEKLRFALSEMNKFWFNTSTVRRRQFDYQLVSMHNSGSHWLKYSLGVAISMTKGVAPPEHIQSDRLVGHPKTLPEAVPGVPCIVHSHSLPHLFLASRLMRRFMSFPKYIVLVRDIESSLFSTYVKWQADFPGVSFRDFVHEGAFGGGPVGGLWHEIAFYNGWRRVARAAPDDVLIVRYEDMQADTQTIFNQVWAYLGFDPLTEDQMEELLHRTSKEEMAKRPNPEIPRTVVRQDKRQVEEVLSPEDRAFVRAQCRAHLIDDYGYDF